MLAARQAAEKYELSAEESIGAVKVLIQEDLAMWLCHPDRQLKLLDEEPEIGPDPNISFQHALIELILTAKEDVFSQHVLPEKSIVLRRHQNFSKQYSALRLSEEADLVVARINGQRSITDILSRSSLPEAEIFRLLAALTSAGILEIALLEEQTESAPESSPETDREGLDVTLLQEDSPSPGEVPPRNLPRWLVPTAAAAVLLLITVLWFVFSKPSNPTQVTGHGAHWGIVVDLACEAADYRRLMQMANSRNDVLALATEGDSSAPCWRLVWGDFSSKLKAEEKISSVPKKLIPPGFKAHVIEYQPPKKPETAN